MLDAAAVFHLISSVAIIHGSPGLKVNTDSKKTALIHSNAAKSVQAIQNAVTTAFRVMRRRRMILLW
jgi:hypothetical protein